MKKRQVAAGLWQLKENLFEIRVRVVHPRTKKHVARWRKFEGNKSEALLAREQWRQELLDELTNRRPRETVASYAASWIRTKLNRGDLAGSTARKYADALDRHILPAFGDAYIDQLERRDISEWIGEKRTGYAASTCNSWLRVFATLLADAHGDGIVPRNVAAAVKPLRERDDVDEDNALSPDELRAYLDAWRVLYPDFHSLVLLLALTGVRWGEATSLKWSDIDKAQQTGTLCIRRSHWCGEVKETKTGKRRTVAYPTILADTMREHRQRAVARQCPSLNAGWCFVASNGQLLRHGRLSNENAVVLKKAGIDRRVTIHGLRRTMTDLLRLASVDQVTATALIGHETDRMRQHYSTVRAEETRAAGDKVVGLLGLPSDGRSDGRTESGREKGQSA